MGWGAGLAPIILPCVGMGFNSTAAGIRANPGLGCGHYRDAILAKHVCVSPLQRCRIIFRSTALSWDDRHVPPGVTRLQPVANMLNQSCDIQI